MENSMVSIKSPDIFIGLMSQKFHPTLVEIASHVIYKLIELKVQPVITSAYRPLDANSVHKYKRAIDFRTWDMSPELVIDICSYVNSTWSYDPDRPEKECLLFHDTGRGPHLHLQVHESTEKI